MVKKKKNNATSVVRNNYQENRKPSTVQTPVKVAEFIADRVKENVWPAQVLDIGCHEGRLSDPYRCEEDGESLVTGIDLEPSKKSYGEFIIKDFLCSTMLDFRTFLGGDLRDTDRLIVCNPPFNDETGAYGRKLLPELFLRHIIKLFGPNVPTVFFTPMGLLKNQRVKSDRWRWLRDNVNITGSLQLPINIWETGQLVHSEVLFINIPVKKPIMFLED